MNHVESVMSKHRANEEADEEEKEPTISRPVGTVRSPIALPADVDDRHAAVSGDERQAFLLTPDDLAKVDKALHTFSGQPASYSTSCADGVTRWFTSDVELADYPNTKDGAITDIRVSTTSQLHDRDGSISFKNSDLGTISYQFRGPEPAVTAARDAVRVSIEETRTWFHSIAVRNFVSVAFAVVTVPAVLGILLGAYFVFDPPPTPADPESAASRFGLNLVVVTVIGVVALGWGMNRLVSFFFPVANFAIGAGLRRYERENAIRKAVVVAFAVSVAAGLTAWAVTWAVTA